MGMFGEMKGGKDNVLTNILFCITKFVITKRCEIILQPQKLKKSIIRNYSNTIQV